MLHLDLKKAQELVAEAITDKGAGYVYEKNGSACNYVHGLDKVWDNEVEDYVTDLSSVTTGCLVGHALKLGGIPLEAMVSNNDGDAGTLLAHLRGKEFLTYSEDAHYYMLNAQGSQDQGAPWGQAAEAAGRGKTLEPKYNAYGPTGEFYETDGYSRS